MRPDRVKDLFSISVTAHCGMKTRVFIICGVALLTLAEIAQLGERQTEDLKVPGSNPENSHEF